MVGLLWTTVCEVLPTSVAKALCGIVPRVLADLQEIRLRCGETVVLTTANGQVVTDVFTDTAIVRDCFLRCCSYAVHTHQEELCNGFVTTASGIRVGVAGAAVIKDGRVVSCRDITSLCLRLPRAVDGCAMPLLPIIEQEGQLSSVLLCGPPASGKTTVLRDAAQLLARRYAVTMVDERRELAVGGCVGCDVLRGYPKGDGIRQAVRTLAPDVIVADELGAPSEWEAVIRSCYCGVAVIASAHIASMRDVYARRELMTALENGAFSSLVFMPPRTRAHEPSEIVKARDILENTGRVACRVCLRGDGHQSGMGVAV